MINKILYTIFGTVLIIIFGAVISLTLSLFLDMAVDVMVYAKMLLIGLVLTILGFIIWIVSELIKEN